MATTATGGSGDTGSTPFEDIRWDAEEMLDFGDALLVSAHRGGVDPAVASP